MTEELNQQREHDKEYFELFEGIKTQERIIELRKEDIHKNAVGHYDACRHSDLIRDIEIATQIIEVYKAKISEAKRQKKRQIEFLESLLHNLNVAECDRDSQQTGDSAKWKSEADKVKFETSALHSESTTDALSSISAIIEEIKILKMEVERE